jgi:hypothetical protein
VILWFCHGETWNNRIKIYRTTGQTSKLSFLLHYYFYCSIS